MAHPPNRASQWRLRSVTLEFGRVPLLMGIVNVTPDSFSDGGKFLDSDAAIEHGLQLVQDGADILDIGGESTRPYAEPVDEGEELRRVRDVIAGLSAHAGVPLSVDTSKASVADSAIDAGAEIINDVTALEGDPRMLDVAKETAAGVCVMHMQGTPRTMQDDPKYDDVVAEVRDDLARRRDRLAAAGIDPLRVALDPGVGFGKTHNHNLQLLAAAATFVNLGQPLVVGHSRKGFIGKVLGVKTLDRAAGTVGVAMALAAAAVQVIRVHDVAAVRQALALFDAVGGVDGEANLLPED